MLSGYIRVSARLHVKVLSSAAVPLELFRLLTPRSFRNGSYRATNESKVILLWSCQDARQASNVVKRLYAVSDKKQGNLLNEEIKLNHNSAGPKQEILITIYTVYTAISRKVVGKSARDNPKRYCGWL